MLSDNNLYRKIFISHIRLVIVAQEGSIHQQVKKLQQSTKVKVRPEIKSDHEDVTASFCFIICMPCLTQINLIPPHRTSSGFPHNLRGKRSDSTWMMPGGRDSVPCGLSLVHVTTSISCHPSLPYQTTWLYKYVSIVVIDRSYKLQLQKLLHHMGINQTWHSIPAQA